MTEMFFVARVFELVMGGVLGIFLVLNEICSKHALNVSFLGLHIIIRMVSDYYFFITSYFGIEGLTGSLLDWNTIDFSLFTEVAF